jgi:lysyl-tRNA synthetase class I
MRTRPEGRKAMTNQFSIDKLYEEFEAALRNYRAASLAADDDAAAFVELVLPCIIPLASAYGELLSHPNVDEAKTNQIVLRLWNE